MAYLSIAGGAGGSGKSSDQVALLQAQFNRFVGAAASPLAYTIPIPVNGVLDLNTTLRAMTILTVRAADILKLAQGATAAQYRPILIEASTHMADPDYVAAHLADITAMVGLYADSLGLPPPTGTRFTAFNYKLAAIIGGVGLLFWWSSRRKGRR